MEVTKPYRFIGFWALAATKLYKAIRFWALVVTKPYKCVHKLIFLFVPKTPLLNLGT